MTTNKRILLGVTGGIAAYKAAQLVSGMKKKGWDVKVIMTDHATEFVTPLTFQTLSENRVYVDMFAPVNNMEVEHISLAKWADVIVIAPGSANTIGKFAYGIGDNMLTTVVLAKRSPIIIAPAMNTAMLENPATVENMNRLKERGFILMDTSSGRLACGDEGAGKMAEPEAIIEEIEGVFQPKTLLGKKIIVTSGGTREPLDPVRYLGNRSSGKTGYALAKILKQRGAQVVLVTAPTALQPPNGVEVESVETTREMLEAVNKHYASCDALISPAAPADYRVDNFSSQKIKKVPGQGVPELHLVENPDILKHFAAQKGDRIHIGFAAESENLEEFAKKKLEGKNLDLIVANNITRPGAGFSTDTNIVTFIDREGVYPMDMMSKERLGEMIADRLTALMEKKSRK